MIHDHLFDIYEILLKDEKDLKEKIKKELSVFLSKSVYFKYIPIFRLAYKTSLEEQIQKVIFFELSTSLTNIPIDDILYILSSEEIQNLLREKYFDEKNYR